MSETTATPSAAGDAPAASTDSATAESLAASLEKTDLSIRSLLEVGAHFGHQTHRWNPLMRPHIFGSRNGTHILDLDQTLPAFRAGLERVREAVAEGDGVLFVGTKRQAAAAVMAQAQRCNQYYVNNRWLGGMLTNWKTVKKSIDTYKTLLDIQGDEEKQAAHSKKELSRVNRLSDKYEKSLAGIKDMQRIPSVIFVVDVGKESIAISEARRLGITIIGVVDSNRDPRGIDYVVPGNDDATRAIELYCKCVADACLEGEAQRQDKLLAEKEAAPKAEDKKSIPGTGRRVVEINQPPRRGRGGGGGGSGGGRTQSAGGWAEKRQAEAAAAPSAPEVLAPEVPAPEASAPEAPTPEAPAAEASAPETPAPEAPEAAAPAVETPADESPAKSSAESAEKTEE